MVFCGGPLRLRRLALTALLAFVAAAPARAEVHADVAMDAGSLTSIRFSALSEAGAYTGFFPVRVRIENRAAVARTWEVALSVNSPASGANARLTATHQVSAAPGSTQETVLFLAVPFESLTGFRFGANVMGEIRGPEVAREMFSFGMTAGPGVVGQRISVSASLKPAFSRVIEEANAKAEQARAAGAAGGRSGRPTRISLLRDGFSSVDPKRWPADWRTWSMFQAVVLGPAEWELLEAAPRRALLDWVEMGGRLWLVTPAAVARTETASRGLGAVIRHQGPVAAFLPGGQLAEGAGPAWKNPPRLFDPADPQFQFNPAGRWLMFFLVGFAVVVGPLNLFWFAPVGRRHRLFVTTPIISLVGAVALAGAAVWGDGFGGVGARQSLVVLQPAGNQAVVLQNQVARTGLLLGRSFDLPADTLLVRVFEEGFRGARAELERDGDRATGDWFASRSLQRQELRRLVPTRARVELVEGGGGQPPVLQSSLGTTLRELRYTDASGTTWTAAKLPPGRRVTLVAAASPGVGGSTAGVGGPGWFTAEGGAGDLAPIPTLESIAWKDSRVWYAGPVVKPEARP